MNIETSSFLSIKSKLDAFDRKKSSFSDKFVMKGFGASNRQTRRNGMVLPDKFNHESVPRMGHIDDEEVHSNDSFFNQ